LGRGLAKGLALLAGALVGLLVILVLAASFGLWHPAGNPVSSTPTTASAPPPPTPTSVPGAVPVGSLAELGDKAASLHGKLIQVVVTDQEMTAEAGPYLSGQSSGAITNVRVTSHPGKLILTGTAKQGILATDFSIVGHPVIVDGVLKLMIDSIDPSMLTLFAPVAVGQTVDLGMTFQAKSAEVGEGRTVVTGVVP